jgi:hypothetical protein
MAADDARVDPALLEALYRTYADARTATSVACEPDESIQDAMTLRSEASTPDAPRPSVAKGGMSSRRIYKRRQPREQHIDRRWSDRTASPNSSPTTPQSTIAPVKGSDGETPPRRHRCPSACWPPRWQF